MGSWETLQRAKEQKPRPPGTSGGLDGAHLGVPEEHSGGRPRSPPPEESIARRRLSGACKAAVGLGRWAQGGHGSPGGRTHSLGDRPNGSPVRGSVSRGGDPVALSSLSNLETSVAI